MPFAQYSPAAAAWETAAFAGTRLAAAYYLGEAIGTEIHNLIQTYDPSLDDAIGGTLDQMLQQLVNAQTAAEQQQWIAAIKALFGVHDDGTSNTATNKQAGPTVGAVGKDGAGGDGIGGVNTCCVTYPYDGGSTGGGGFIEIIPGTGSGDSAINIHP
jgi:hypothetical protein